jgi:hypothetical protein
MIIKYLKMGWLLLNDTTYKVGQKQNQSEVLKMPKRTEVINFLLSLANDNTSYLEIGVRNPDDNYNHILATEKYSVDPGYEFKANPVNFKVTSDDFFDLLARGEILSKDMKFDVIFIDGLHLAGQVDRDISNSLQYIKDDGFIVLHDCNPPSEWHAREDYDYKFTPADINWNGTTWKAFLKRRTDPSLQSCCIDSDWGVGIISKSHLIGKNYQGGNLFFEFSEFSKSRIDSLNLISFDRLKELLGP